MKKRILIISYYFAPNGEIGARRPTKISEHLHKDGYKVDVFTYGYNGNDTGDNVSSDITIFRINNNVVKKESKTNTILKKEQKSLLSNVLMPIKKHYREYLAIKRQNVLFEEFKKHFKNVDIGQEYDCIFTTYGPISSVEIGLYIKKKYRNVKWVCDFRDPMVHELTPLMYKLVYKNKQNKACKMADSIVAVSNGYLQRICRGKYSDKSYMIPNGYDEEDVVNNNEISPFFTLTYVGSMYQGKRDFSALFYSIKSLFDKKLLSKELIKFEYAGHEIDYLMAQARKYQIEDIIHNNGQLSHRECVELEAQSSILLLSTWNNSGEEGVFPGKFLEYLQFNKPIIAIVEGNKANSEISQVINDGNIGIAYESQNKMIDQHKLENYLLEAYKEFVEYGSVTFKPNIDITSRYEYKTIMMALEGIIDDEQ